MSRFEIRDKFYLDGKPFKVISGSIHYFRTVPEYWQDRLEKLVNIGCNTNSSFLFPPYSIALFYNIHDFYRKRKLLFYHSSMETLYLRRKYSNWSR